MGKFSHSTKTVGTRESATGRFVTLPSTVAFPAGLRVRVIDKSVLTEAGRKALEGDVVNVDRLQKQAG